jgi:hypothetical protein
MKGCGRFSLVGIEGGRCGVYPMRCKKWSCPVCGPRKVKATLARTRAGMSMGPCRFFTLTSPGAEDAETSYAEFPARFKRFRMRLERRFGRIEYLAVVERQKRGAATSTSCTAVPTSPSSGSPEWRPSAASGGSRISGARTRSS